MRCRVKNVSRQPRGVRSTQPPGYVLIKPGEEREVDIPDDEVRSMLASTAFEVSQVGAIP